MERWWDENEEVFRKYSIAVDGHACITAISGMEDAFRERKEGSGKETRKLLLDLMKPTGSGWKGENVRTWFTELMGKMMKMLPRRLGHPTSRELVERLGECGFSKKEAAVIANSIVEIRAQSGTLVDSDGES